MQNGRFEGVHGSETFAHIDKDGEDLGFRETFAQATVHHVDDASARTELHEDEDFVSAVGHPVPSGVDKEDDVRVALEDPLRNMRSQGAQEEMMGFQSPLCRLPS